MKKTGFILAIVVLTMLCCVPVFAATGEELLGTADLYLTFEDEVKNVNEKYELSMDGDASFVDGKFGKAFAMEIGGNPIIVDELKFGTDSFTVTAWLNCHEHSGDPAIFGNKDWNNGGNAGWVFCMCDNEWKYNANTDGGSRVDSGYSYFSAPIESELDTWYHIALVVDREAETYTLYVNGQQYGKSADFSGSGHTDSAYDDEWNEYPFTIGDDGTGIYNLSQTFACDYDEVAVFKKALSADDVVAIYTYAPAGEEAAVIKTAAEEELTFTADAAEVLKTADVYLTFEDGVKNVNGKYTVTSNGETTTANGKIGKAAHIASSANYLTVEDFTFGTDSFTITSWVKCNEYSGDPVLFGNKDWGNGSNPGWLLCLTGEQWKYNANTAAGTRTDTAFSLNTTITGLNDWHHIALVVDRAAQTYSFYLNGRLYGRAIDFSEALHEDGAYDDEANLYPFNIGEDGTGSYNTADGQKLDCDVDEIAVFKKALTADEIAAIFSYSPISAAAAATTPETTADTESPSTPEEPQTTPAANETVPETPATETVKSNLAPQTPDVVIITVAAAVISAAGAALSRKRK